MKKKLARSISGPDQPKVGGKEHKMKDELPGVGRIISCPVRKIRGRIKGMITPVDYGWGL